MPALDLDTAVRLATIELRSKEEAKSTPRVQDVQQEEEWIILEKQQPWKQLQQEQDDLYVHTEN